MVLIIYTADEVLWRGLKLFHIEPETLERQSRASHLEAFKGVFGTHPLVLAVMWEELQTTTVAAARINTQKRSVHLKNFLRAHFFLYRYPTEIERKVHFGGRTTPKTIRKWCWYFLKRIQALKVSKVCTQSVLAICSCCNLFLSLLALFPCSPTDRLASRRQLEYIVHCQH